MTTTQPATAHTAIEFEACVDFLTEQLETLPEHHQRTLVRSDERGREVLIPARRYADNFTGRLVLRIWNADTQTWDVVTSTDKPRVAALFYFA